MFTEYAMKNWVSLKFHYLGQSNSKNHIFRAKRWINKFERIFKKAVFNEKYQKIGRVHDIFGPAQAPYISVKITSPKEFSPHVKLYIKMN